VAIIVGLSIVVNDRMRISVHFVFVCSCFSSLFNSLSSHLAGIKHFPLSLDLNVLSRIKVNIFFGMISVMFACVKFEYGNDCILFYHQKLLLFDITLLSLVSVIQF